MDKIDGKTLLCAVFGDPVSHSFSPNMHNAAFRALGINCVYVACQVTPDRLPDAVGAIRALGMRGANITIPHKQAVASLVDQVCGDAAQSGSVNTIVNQNGRLYGYSTDGLGLVRSLGEECHYDVQGKNILLLGAGGAAAAVVYRLAESGIRSLTIVNRNISKARNLQEKLSSSFEIPVNVIPLTDLPNLSLTPFHLLINTTSVGLHEQASLLKQEQLHPGLFVYDLVYRRGGTVLESQARNAGCQVLSGLSLLLYQGAESFRLWFDVDPPLAQMREALELAAN